MPKSAVISVGVPLVSLLLIYSLFNWLVGFSDREAAAERKENRQKTCSARTIPKLEITEAKYRHLVDDSSDLIFQMNEDAQILSMNKTAHTMLGYLPEKWSAGGFMKSCLMGSKAIRLNRNIVREHLREFFDGKSLITFCTTLRKNTCTNRYRRTDHVRQPDPWNLEIIGKSNT